MPDISSNPLAFLRLLRAEPAVFLVEVFLDRFGAADFLAVERLAGFLAVVRRAVFRFVEDVFLLVAAFFGAAFRRVVVLRVAVFLVLACFVLDFLATALRAGDFLAVALLAFGLADFLVAFFALLAPPHSSWCW